MADASRLSSKSRGGRWPGSALLPLPPSLATGVDVSDCGSTHVHEWTVAGINADGNLQLMGHRYSDGQPHEWNEPEYSAPLSQQLLEYLPSVCATEGAGAAMHTYVMVTAGDRLWYAVKKVDATNAGFSAWRLLSDVPVSSAPNCHFHAKEGEARQLHPRTRGSPPPMRKTGFAGDSVQRLVDSVLRRCCQPPDTAVMAEGHAIGA